MILRVFPRRTSLTPRDEYAFVGDPPLFRPEASEVAVSCAFTWDIPEAKRLADAWGQYYPIVNLGGPAFGQKPNGFTPGLYLRHGVTFSSRGCDRGCPWCLVPLREGHLTLIDDFAPGYIIQDNNFLSCPPAHRATVYQMLNKQRHAAVFSGGLQASLATDAVAEELRGVRIAEVFLAADTDGALKPLEMALKRLSFLKRRQLRCYVLCAYGGETISQAEARLERVWELGGLPFAQLFQPADRYIEYVDEWRALQRKWSRPAAMFATHPAASPAGTRENDSS